MGKSVTDGVGVPLRQARWLTPVRRVLGSRESALVVALIGTIAIATFLNPVFLSPANLRNVVLDVSILIIVATGQTLVIMTRNFDLSVAAILALSAYVMGMVFISLPELPVPLGVGVALLCGITLGAFNGFLVAALAVPSIIATIGTLSVFRGLAFVLAGGSQIGRNQLPDELVAFTQRGPLGVPWLVVLAISVAIVAEVFLRRFRVGRNVLAVGSNPEAARLRGIPIRAVLLGVFALSGFLAGLAGAMFAGRYGNVNPSDASGFELLVIAAVVIGGTSVSGGSGSVLGTVIGCLLLGAIANSLTISNVDPLWQVAVQGAVILAAATLAAVLNQRRATRRDRFAR